MWNTTLLSNFAVVEKEEFAADTEMILVEHSHCLSWNDMFDIPGRKPGFAVSRYCDRLIYNNAKLMDQDLFVYVDQK